MPVCCRPRYKKLLAICTHLSSECRMLYVECWSALTVKINVQILVHKVHICHFFKSQRSLFEERTTTTTITSQYCWKKIGTKAKSEGWKNHYKNGKQHPRIIHIDLGWPRWWKLKTISQTDFYVTEMKESRGVGRRASGFILPVPAITCPCCHVLLCYLWCTFYA